MFKLIVHSYVTKKSYDVTNIVTRVDISYKRTGSAGKFEFELIKDDVIVYHEGDCVEFYEDNLPIFKGYVFTKTSNKDKIIKTVAYDQLRYLKAKDSFEFIGYSLSDVVNHIANEFKLNVGLLQDTGYRLPYVLHEDKSLFDIITYHQQKDIIATGVEWNFYDDFGKLTVQRADEMTVKTVLGNKSFATDYEYKTDIDGQTYNVIKLAQKNKDTGKTDIYMSKNNESINRHGMLQLYEVVDENVNEAQVKEKLALMSKYHNKIFRTLSLEAIGIPGLRAGNIIRIDIPDIGDISLDKYLIVDEITHKYTKDSHTMKLELDVR